MNKKVIIGLVLGFSILLPLFIFVIMQSSGQPTPKTTHNPGAKKIPSSGKTMEADGHSIASLTPHQSTVSEVFATLGSPAKSVQHDGYTILYYPLEGSDRSHKVYIKDGLVDYTIESFVADNKFYTEYLAKKKKPNGVIYNLYDNDGGFDLFVFSQAGIAYLANAPSGYTTEIHRFAPIAYQLFFTQLAPKLTFN